MINLQIENIIFRFGEGVSFLQLLNFACHFENVTKSENDDGEMRVQLRQCIHYISAYYSVVR